MARPSPGSVSFQGAIVLPAGAGAVEMSELDLPEANKRELLKELLPSMRIGTGFEMEFVVAASAPAVTVRFHRIGETAAFFMLSHDQNGAPAHIFGLTALLQRLDADEDRQAIEHVRRHAVLSAIDPSTFDKISASASPVAATFFSDVGSAKYPPVHTVIKIVSAAFFGQFGDGTGK